MTASAEVGAVLDSVTLRAVSQVLRGVRVPDAARASRSSVGLARYSPRVFEVTREEFESFVDDALDSIPEDFATKIVNLAFLVDDESEKDDLFGLYEGVPLTKRGSYSGAMPDRITIFQHAICRACNTEDEVREQVRKTVLHEIGHYFGIDDPRLRELDYESTVVARRESAEHATAQGYRVTRVATSTGITRSVFSWYSA